MAWLESRRKATFCLLAGQLGYPIHVDTRAKIGHHKSALLTEDRFLQQGV